MSTITDEAGPPVGWNAAQFVVHFHQRTAATGLVGDGAPA
jgi:hypothetical protein